MKRTLINKRNPGGGLSVLNTMSIPGGENDIQRTNWDHVWANHSSHRVASVAKRSTFSFGGYKWTGSPNYIANSQRYDAFADAWSAETALASARWVVYGCTIGWEMFCVGGAAAAALTNVDMYSVFTAAFTAMTALAVGQNGKQHFDSTMQAHGYVEFGFTSNVVESYERFTDARSAMGNQANARAAQSHATFGKMGAVANGYNGSANVNETYRYYRGPDSWVAGTAVGAAWRGGLMCVEHASKLWVAGFYDTATRNTTKCYLAGADTWRTPSAPTTTGSGGPINAVYNGNILQRGPGTGGTAGTTVQGYFLRTEAEFNMADDSVRQSYCDHETYI